MKRICISGMQLRGALVVMATVTSMSWPARANDWSSVGLDASHGRASHERSGWQFQSSAWKTTLPDAPWTTSSPAVADGLLVVGTRDGSIHAVRASTGRRVWQFNAHAGILSAPAILSGRVFVSSLDGNLYALALGNGSLLWKKELGGLTHSAPTVVGDSVVVAAGFPDRRLFRFEATTGRTIWETKPNVMAQFSNSSGVSDGDQVIVGAQEGHLYSFEFSTGALRWTYEADGMINVSAPVLANGRVYLLPGGESNRFHAVDATTGLAVSGWPVALPDPPSDTVTGKRVTRQHAVSSLAATAQRLWFDVRFDDSLDTDSDGAPDQFLMREFVMSIDAADGSVLWQQANGRRVVDNMNDVPKNWLCPTPALYRAIGTSEAFPYVAAASSLDAALRVFDAGTGSRRINIATAGTSRSSPVLANGRLFVVTETGVIQSFLSNTNVPPDAPAMLGLPGRSVNLSPLVAWSQSLDLQGDAVSYQLRWDRDGEVLQTWEGEIATTKETSARLKNLTANTPYAVAVRARDVNGAWSDWSAPQTIWAKESPLVVVGGANQDSLIAALSHAQPGDVVTLGAGTFYLSETLRVPAGVGMDGAGPGQTVIDGTGQATAVSFEGTVDGHASSLSRLTVANAKIGIAVRDAKNVIIKNAIIRDNSDVGVDVSASGVAAVTNVTLASNWRAARSFGTLTVKNSIVTANQIGFIADHVGAIVSRFNDFFDNPTPVSGMARSTSDLTSSIAFANYPKRDLRVLRAQPTTDQGDPADDASAEPMPNGGRVNLGAYGATAEAELSAAAPSPTSAPSNPSASGCSVANGTNTDSTHPDASHSSRWLVSLGFALLALVFVRRRRRRAITVGLLALIASLSPRPSSAITCTWKSTGGTGGNVFSQSDKWTLSGTGGNAACPPGSNDTAVFNTGSVACTNAATVSVSSFQMNSGYSGTFTQGQFSMTTSGNFNVGAGTFAGTGGASGVKVVVGGDFNLSGGTFTSTAHRLEVLGALNITAGTFNANGGEVMLRAASSKTLATNGATFNDVVINDGMVGYWKLDEAAGAVANTTTADNSSGFFTNPVYGATAPTQSTTSQPSVNFYDPAYLTFNGSSSYAAVANFTVYEFTAADDYTLSAWVKVTNLTSSSYQGVVTFSRDVSPWWGLWITPGNTGSPRWMSGSPSQAATGSVVTAGWHHVVIRQQGSGSGNTQKIYVDGTDTTTSSFTAQDGSGGGTISFGRSALPGEYFTGSLDDVRVYDRALSTTEISTLAAGNLPATTGGGTQTVTGNPTISGDLVIASGTLAGGNTSIGVAGNWWNYGGLFTTGTTGTVTFNGSTSGNKIQAGGSSFNNMTVSGTGAWAISDTGAITIGKNFSQSAGTFTSTPDLLNIQGAFSNTGGTFTHNGGRVMLSSTSSQTFASNGATFKDLIINDGLVGYWKLDETSGTTSADSSGYGNDGTFYNTPTISSAVPTLAFADARSVQFAGSSSEYISTGTTLPTELMPSIVTVSAWYKATTVDTSGGELVSGSNRYVIRVTSTGVTLAKQYGASSWIEVAGTTSGQLDGNWHHVAGVINASGMYVYYDGALVNSNADTTAIYYTSPTGIQIGRNPVIGNYDFTGNIDEARVYNRTLTAAEIYSLYIGGQPGTSAATQTLTGAPTVAGSMTIASGTLAAGTNSITVAGDWWNYGGAYTSSSGAITFNGTSASSIRSGGSRFQNVTINGSGSWTLADRMEIDPARSLTTTAGTFDLSSYTLRTGDINRNASVTITPSTGTVVLDANSSQTLDTGTFTNVRFEPVAATNLVGYWKLDERQGLTTYDNGSGDHDGTLTNGPLWLASGLSSTIQFENPGALNLDGTNDYVDISTAAISTNAAYSACAWVNLASTSGYQTFVSINGTNVSGFYLQKRSDTGKFAMTMLASDANAATVYKADSTTTPSTSTWYHVCGTYDLANLKVYVNGTLEGTTAFAAPWNATGHTLIGAGRWGAGNVDYTNGKIDDVRIYNAALTAAQVAALAAGTYPTGLAGTPTYTLGYNTTVSGTMAMDSGALTTSSYTLNASSASAAPVVYSGTYTIGSATNTYAGGLTVNKYGTLTMATSGGTLAIGSTKTLNIDGTFNASSTGATIQTAGGASTYYNFNVGSSASATPTLNITGLAVKNTTSNGMYINSVVGSTTTFTRFDNIAFSAGTGTQLLQIYAPTLFLISNGCTFDGGVASGTTTYNATLRGDGSATETRVVFGNSSTAATATTCATNKTPCESYDNDDDSAADGIGDTVASNAAVIQWVHSAVADTNGIIEGFPTAAFDWNTFTYYSTYVTFHDVDSTTADRIYVRDTNGVAKYSWDTPTGVELIGSPRFDTVSSVHYVYVATTSGRVYRLIDTPGSSTLVADSASPWSSSYYDCSCMITTPLTFDSTNLYWGGIKTADSNNYLWTLGKTTKTLASSSPFQVTVVPSGAAPSLWTSGSTYAFLGSSAHFYKVNVSAQSLTTDNNSPTGTVNGRLSILSNKVYGADNAGSLWALDASSFGTTSWSYHDNTNHSGCASGSVCAITGSLYVDPLLTRVFYGDGDGHVYASVSTSGGSQSTGFPFRPGSSSDVFGTAPLYNSGILVIGTTTGSVYIIDVNGGSGPVLKQTYKFGTSTKISGIGYDLSSTSYVVSMSDATAKDGKVVYIDKMTDPTSGSN